jgi:hypothetical protein
VTCLLEAFTAVCDHIGEQLRHRLLRIQRTAHYFRCNFACCHGVHHVPKIVSFHSFRLREPVHEHRDSMFIGEVRHRRVRGQADAHKEAQRFEFHFVAHHPRAVGVCQCPEGGHKAVLHAEGPH